MLNRVELEARVAEIEPLRHTPAGIAIVHLQLQHESQVLEAGSQRRVTLEIQAVALDTVAQSLARAGTGTALHVAGFLAPRRQGSRQLVLHIQQLVQAQ